MKTNVSVKLRFEELLIDNFSRAESFLNFSTVSEGVKHRILQLLADTSQFNANDVLVNIDSNAILPFAANSLQIVKDLSPEIRLIVKTAQKTEKEQGIFPLCVSKGIIEWEFKQSVVRTPLLMFPCKTEISKVNNTIQFDLDEENSFINPFLVNRLKTEFELTIPEDIKSLPEIILFLELNKFQKISEENSFIGNFHHHRFEIIKELEELSSISLNAALSNLLGDESKNESFRLDLSSKLLFPADTDQINVFDVIVNDHTVVQGPPGTGKSQVLSNILSKLLLDKRSAIVVSEKRVALEVLQRKLGQFDLSDLCFIATSETISKDFIGSLKESWIRLEKFNLKAIPNIQLSQQYIDQLQQHLDLLNQERLIGGISFREFQNLTINSAFQKSEFSSDLPIMNEWLLSEKCIQKLFDDGIHYFVSGISPGILQLDSFKQLDQSIQKCLIEIDKIKKLFKLETWNDLQKAMKKAALCQSFESHDFKKHQQILTSDSKEQKKFIRLRKKYLQLHIIQSNLDLEKSNWKYLPSRSETENLMDLISNTSYVGKWKFKKQWSKIANLSIDRASEGLHKWKQYLVNNESISQIEVELCELGIDNVQSEMEVVFQQIHHFSSLDKEEWINIPLIDRRIYAEMNQPLNQLYTYCKANFRWDEHTNIELFLNGVIKNFSVLLQNHDNIRSLNESCLRNLKQFSNYEAMESAVFKSNWTKFTAQFPTFSKFQTSHLLEKCHLIIEEQNKEATSFTEEIRKNQHSNFQEYHKILQTPSAKLNENEKILKNALKKGKAILVKEFSKSKNFPSLRELFASEARIWIQLLKPIWLSNPTQIAKCFPMETALFDVAIFDEASQIPLQNALGAIQRSKRILVAGDHQQMGPSTYFKAQNEEQIDLLHQASFYWKNIPLKHHYRSEHPDLIRFSNFHFYNNDLLTFPSFDQEIKPIDWHYSENGIFDERKNSIEAQKMASFIESQIDSKSHLGIVAFSETQLAEIYFCLSPKSKIKLEQRIDSDTAFFKALENVQGEECDQLIISLGYGKNENGEFHMRFGPLNTKNGTKRLNVLLTRARKKIVFFTSVKGSDFKISSNEAVNMLRLYLLQLEADHIERPELTFPHSIRTKVVGNKLIFEQIYSKIRNANELVTFVRVLEGRSWKLEF